MRQSWLWAVALIGVVACDEKTDPMIIDPVDVAIHDATSFDLAAPDMAPSDMALPDAMRPDQAIVPDVQPPDMWVPDAAPVIPACQNQLDDDQDGATDYPADPGCESLIDEDEADPATPACGDGADNDEDGLIDGDDPGCADMADPSEENHCGPDQTFTDITGQLRIEGTTEGGTAVLSACRQNLAPEAVFLFTLRTQVDRLHFDTAGSAFDTLLSVRSVCADDSEDAEIACNDDASPNNRTSAVDINRPALGDYFVVLDGFLEEQGAFILNVRAEVADDTPCPEPESGLTCRFDSTCIDGTCQPAACSDRLDNDRNGTIDYPNDPGCDAPNDNDETDPEVLPECADGEDNDFNGDTDFPNDRNCTSAADNSESRPPQCRDGVDNDGDGLIDLADPGCEGDPERFSEFNIEECRDGMDNDEDGLTDFPGDPGCDRPRDSTEANPPQPSECFDEIDNDEDGLTDYPEDAESCLFAADTTEDDPCARRDPVEFTGLRDTRGNTEDGLNDFIPSCVGRSGNEELLLWRVAEDRPLVGLRMSTRGSAFGTVLSVRSACNGPELICDDNSAPDGSAFLTLGPQEPGTDLYVLVDGDNAEREGIWRLRTLALLAEGANCAGGEVWRCANGLACREQPGGASLCEVALCANGVDDDADGFTDWPNDPGCDTASDEDEADPDFPRACFNEIDDDEDGLIDFGADPNCDSRSDDAEGPDCADGIDNDEDGLSDFDRNGDGFRDRNTDLGCACANDPSEERNPQCADGCDNDRDGLIDLEDPGCDGPDDDSEFNIEQCRDGLDNDGDGLIDYPDDPGCPDERTALERNPDPLPQCADGIDNDGDGRTDYQQGMGDDGCLAAADNDERGPCDMPQSPLPEGGEVRGNTRGNVGQHNPTCSRNTGADVVFVANIPYPAIVDASTEGSTFDTVLYARSACGPSTVCPLEMAADAGVPDAGAPDAGPMCQPMDSELDCNDDSVGVQSEISFEWEGGDIFFFVDGFSGSSGDYALAVTARYARGGRCGPEMRAFVTCEDGTECLPDDAAGFPTCQPVE